MSPRFCMNCGAPVEPGSSFCGNCGASIKEQLENQGGIVSQTHAPKAPPQPSPASQEQAAFQQPSPEPQKQAGPSQPSPASRQSPQVSQQPAPDRQTQPHVAAPHQTYNMQGSSPPYQQSGYVSNKPVTGAKATGLIVAVFCLIIAAILLVGALLLPSEDDYAITDFSGTDASTDQTTNGSDQPSSTTTQSPKGQEFGSVPEWVLEQVNISAAEEDYVGEYTGSISFFTENMDVVGEMFDNPEEAEFLESLNGKTITCTAVMDEEEINVYSTELPEEIVGSDGNVFSLYYYEITDGLSLDEFTDSDPQMGVTLTQVEGGYFLDDGRIFIISSNTGELSDGQPFGSELRITLNPDS
jgi:hypothetical protein